MKVLSVVVTLGTIYHCCVAAKVDLYSSRPLFSHFFNNGEECDNGLVEKCKDHDTTEWSHRASFVDGDSIATLQCSATSFDLSVSSPPEVTSIRFRVVEWKSKNGKAFVDVNNDNPNCATGWNTPTEIPEPETTTKGLDANDITTHMILPAPNVGDLFGHWQKRSVKPERARGGSRFAMGHGECAQQVVMEEPDCSTSSAVGWTQSTPIVEVTEKITTENPDISIITTTYLTVNCVSVLLNPEPIEMALLESEEPVGEVAQCQSCPFELSIIPVDDALQTVAVTVKRGCAVGPTADSQLGWFIESLAYNQPQNLIVDNGQVTNLGAAIEAYIERWSMSWDEYTLSSNVVLDSVNDELRVDARISYCLKDDNSAGNVQLCGGARLCSSGEQRFGV